MKSNNTKINILVAESIELVRIGLRSLFSDHASFHIVAETTHMKELLELVKLHKPDVVILDLQLSENNNVAESIARLMYASPNSRVLAFSQNNSESAYLQALHSGAAGIISKGHSCKMILKAIHAIASDKGWFDRPVRSTKVPNGIHNKLVGTQNNDVLIDSSKLSNCERRVAGLASQGLSAKEIGARLLISEKTVRNQLSVIYKKMGVKKQVELCLKAHEYKYFQ